MSFKDILSKLDQLSEGDVKHTGTYGTSHGKEDVRDQYGHKIGKVDKEAGAKKEAPKKGRGRPKKGADDSGEVKTYDTKTLGSVFGGGQKPKGQVGKVSKKHSLKEYFDKIDEMMTQQPIPVVGKEGQTQQTGAGFLSISDNSPAGQAMKDAIGKLAQQKKAQIVVPTQGQQSGMQQKPTATTGGATNQPAMAEEDEDYSAKKARAGKDIGKPGKNFAKIAKKAGEKYGSAEKGKKVAGAILAKLRGLKEADLPPQDGLMGAGLGAGRNQGVAEGAKKPDANKNGIPDYAEDGKGPNDLKKKKVKEGMDHKLKAAHHAGKSHALSKQGYNCSYDDMEEARCYHDGYKEGLDECYGQMPIQGSVVADEGAMSTVDDMASFGAHTPEVEEGNAFTAALAKTPKGGKFSVGGKTFTDRTSYDSKVDEMSSMFESWDNQLGSLLEEYQEIQEGLSVSVSKGQQGAPDSVSVTAQDQDADKLLALVKSAGLGLFGDEQAGAEVGVPQGDVQHGGVDVVGDHDGMMALIKKATGGEQPGTLEPADGEDYADEEGHDDGGLDVIKQLTQAIGGGGSDSEEGSGEESDDEESEEQVDEVESEDQQEFQVAEDNPPDTGAAEFQAMDQEVAQDNAAASSHGGAENSNLEEEEGQCDECGMMESDCECDHEEQVEESYANADDDTFQTDIDFMTKIISGGLNKQKSTGQTTIPVIAGQNDREGYSVQESVSDWKKLAGLK